MSILYKLTSCFFLILASVLLSHAEELNLCERTGVLNAKYLGETPPRIVIYDANYGLSQSLSVFVYDKETPNGPFSQIDIRSLEPGKMLSFESKNIGGKYPSQIQNIWVIPRNHCQSSE